jgi:hypothetical protein
VILHSCILDRGAEGEVTQVLRNLLANILPKFWVALLRHNWEYFVCFASLLWKFFIIECLTLPGGILCKDFFTVVIYLSR